jgi:hypothetical protein
MPLWAGQVLTSIFGTALVLILLPAASVSVPFRFALARARVLFPWPFDEATWQRSSWPKHNRQLGFP